MKLINKQYGIRETEELYCVNIGVMQQNMFFMFFLVVTLAKFVREMEITRRDVML